MNNNEYYKGTGGWEGTPDMLGILKPLLFGKGLLIEPTCVNRDMGMYQFHDGRAAKLLSVYHNGQELDENDYIPCLEEGGFILTFRANGLILCDAIGPSYIFTPVIRGQQHR